MTRRRLPRRRYAIALGFVLAGLLAAAAYAIAHEFIVGAPAPPAVKGAFAVGNKARAREVRLIRDSAAYDTVTENARGVIGINSSVGPVVIWAAPTKGGGLCWILDIERMHRAHHLPGGATSCDPYPWRNSTVIEADMGDTRVGETMLRLVDGRTRRDVASVELRYSDGTTDELQVIGGFFLGELREGLQPSLLIARDRHGDELKRQPIPTREALPQVHRPLGPERVLIRLQTSSGHELTFGVTHDASGQFCRVTHFRGSGSLECEPTDPRDRVAPDDFAVNVGMWTKASDHKTLLTLDGVVGSEIARLALRYRDGTEVPVPIVDRFVVFEVPRDRYNESRLVLTGYNSAADVIARRVVR
jgi:hypothetical protein